jgi:phospholipid/cholesterol/gamma-HCH transport system permease protein
MQSGRRLREPSYVEIAETELEPGIAALPGAATAQARYRAADRTLVVHLSGAWALEHAVPSFDRLLEHDGVLPRLDAVELEGAGLRAWDGSLLAFVLRGIGYCEGNGLAFRALNTPDEILRILDLARAVPERAPVPRTAALPFLARLGAQGIASASRVLGSIDFLGTVGASVARLVTLRSRMRWRDFWVVVQGNSSGALPIVTLISFLVGLIIAFLGAVVLSRFGAGYYVSYLVGYGVLREMAALMTGIILAGRTGAAFAAELGSMKLGEEIDALNTFGISPVDHLVLPRVMGLFVMMPLLTIYSMFVGILGGLFVAVTILDLTTTQFVGGLLTAVTLSDGLLGVFKATIFGGIIGIAGCMRGMQTGSDAGAVGRAATSAVVTGITLVIAANALIDGIAALLGI